MQQPFNTGLQTPQAKQMGLFLHLSQLLNLILPPAGLIVPIVLWQIKKNEFPALDAHGKMVANWIISSLIYFVVSFVLVFVLIGIILLPILGILSIVFPVIGAIKANNGEFWEYPLTIKFLK